MRYKLLLFDLDGTLLKSDKTISEHTLSVLNKCRSNGLMIGVSTSRSEQNSMEFLSQLFPDILISSGGALVKQNQSWGDSIYTDFKNFNQTALKMCVEIYDSNAADKLKKTLTDCDCIRFSDGFWYKFTKKGVTKENAIKKICSSCDITPENIIAFGDDLADIGMLKLCGMGIAMGNAIQEVKDIADVVIGTNDNEGIASFLVKEFEL